MVQPVIYQITKVNIPLLSRFFILNDISELIKGNMRLLISNLLEAARMLIAKDWENAQIPSKNEWIIKIPGIMLMNKLTAMCRIQNGQPKAV